MKTLLFLITFVPATAFCQGFLPRWEMSLSTDMNSFSDAGGAHSQLALAFRPGLFLVQGLSVEPEFFWGTMKGQAPALNLSGNLSYSYGMGYNMFVPFVLVGYGAGNGFPFYEPMPKEYGALHPYSIAFLNAGGGLKIMTFGGRSLVRIEYRYQAFNADLGGVTYKVFARRILVGFSVLL